MVFRSVKEIMQQYPQKYILNPTIDRVFTCWEKVIKELGLTEYVELSAYGRGGKLYIKASHPAVKQEVLYKKKQIIKEINSQIGKRIIREIIFE
jgi:hypothetical protein